MHSRTISTATVKDWGFEEGERGEREVKIHV